MPTFHRRRLVASLMAAWLCFSTVVVVPVAEAGSMDAILDGMFVQTTSPGAFKSQSSLGVIGGSAALRIPTRQINIASFDPPRISAGCGGVDLFMGSFKFIDAQQLVAVFRMIVQGAVAALFKIAINSISGQLGSAMTEFGTALRELNSSFKNSCTLAEDIASGHMQERLDKVKDAAGNVGKKFEAMVGAAGSFMNNFIEGFGKSDANKRRKITDNPTFGNQTWRRIVRSGVVNNIQLPAGTSQELFAQVLMNVTGGVIIPTEEVQQDGTCPANSTKKDVACQGPIEVIPRLPTLVNLLKNTEDHVLHVCDDNKGEFSRANLSEEFSCQSTRKVNAATALTMDGTKSYVSRMLFGFDITTGGYPTRENITASSLVGNIIGAAGINSDRSAMDKFSRELAHFRTPHLRHLLVVQRNPDAAIYVATRLVDVMAEDMAVQFAKAVLQAGNSSLGGKVDIAIPPGYRESLKFLHDEIQQVEGTIAQQLKAETEIQTWVDYMSKTLPGAIPAPGNASLKGR